MSYSLDVPPNRPNSCLNMASRLSQPLLSPQPERRCLYNCLLRQGSQYETKEKGYLSQPQSQFHQLPCFTACVFPLRKGLGIPLLWSGAGMVHKRSLCKLGQAWSRKGFFPRRRMCLFAVISARTHWGHQVAAWMEGRLPVVEHAGGKENDQSIQNEEKDLGNFTCKHEGTKTQGRKWHERSHAGYPDGWMHCRPSAVCHTIGCGLASSVYVWGENKILSLYHSQEPMRQDSIQINMWVNTNAKAMGTFNKIVGQDLP